MKKFLGCLGVVALVLVLGLVGLLVLGAYMSGKVQEEFFEVVSAGDVSALEQMMSPLLRVQVNPVILAAVVESVGEVLGTYEGPSMEGFEIESGAGGFQRVTGVARFSKGDVPCELTYIDGKLLGFDIQNEEVVARAFSRPEVLEHFKAQGQLFLESALTGKLNEVYGLLNEEIQTQMTQVQIQGVADTALSEYGAFQSATFAALKDEAIETGHLKIYYDMVYEKASLTAQVDFGFKGMQASIWGFYFAM